ncbi:MAG: hypothetical protein QXO84_00195 [Candidatus Aenigmatarchaeota archaeon]
MGIFDRFRKKDAELDPTLPTMPINQLPKTQESVDVKPLDVKEDSTKIKMDLILSELSNLKMQLEMINERLKIIEKKIEEKGTIKYV